MVATASTDEEMEARAFIARDRHADRLIIGAGEAVDEVQATGEWVATDSPVEAEP